jgi:outer membrane receptor protein involved in Fe transport
MNLKLFFTVSCLFLAGFSLAQHGKISGKVQDFKTGEELFGASVVIKETQQGTATDIDGRFLLTGVAPGSYTLEIKYVAYQTKEVKIKVEAESTASIDIKLEDAIEELGEIVVKGQMKKETVNSLLIEQKRSSIIGNGISSETIRQSPDNNTGEAMKRISGATIQGGKFAIIRGLNDRYNAAMINGSPLPSTEPERRSFSFDLFPSAMLDQLLIIKSARPDLPGDFAGGIIQLTTRETPEKAFFSISASGGYNHLTTFKKFHSYQGSPTDKWGFDNGTRQLPADFPSSEQLRQGINYERAQKEVEAGKMLNNNYSLLERNALPNLGFQVAGGKTFELKKSKLGVIFSGNYNNSRSFQPVEKSWFDFSSNPQFEYTDSSYEQNARMGALLNLSYRFLENHKISLKSSFNRSGENTLTERRGPSQAEGIYKKAYSYMFTQNTMALNQLNGEHDLEKHRIRINWEYSFGFVNRKIPDYKNVEYRGSSPENLELGVVGAANENAARLFTDLKEKVNSYGYSASVPLSFIKKSMGIHEFKAGGFHQLKSRNFDARMMGFAIAWIPTFNSDLRTLPIDRVFDYENISMEGFRLNDITNPSHKYRAQSTLHAGFAMLESSFGNRWKFIWGARLESYNQQMVSATRNNELVDINTTFNDWLPSLNVIYTLTEKSSVRASASKTVSRPELRELAPFSFYDFSTFSSLEGNSGLQRAAIQNYDLRYEIYPSAGEVFSAAVFYKDFTNPIELLLANDITLGVIRRTFVNLPGAKNYGAEMDFRKNLSKSLTAYGNFSYIFTKVDLSGNPNRWNEKRTMQGQSPYIINVGMLYKIEKLDMTVSALYNIFGDRIYNVGNSGMPDIYEAARHILDLQVSKLFFKKKMETKLSISDVFANDLVFYMDYARTGKYYSPGNRTVFRYTMPRVFSLSIGYKL